MHEVLQIISVQCLSSISRKNWVNFLHADRHGSLSQVDCIIFHGFGQACLNYPSKFAIPSWHQKKEVRNEVKDLTALAGSNATLTIYYTSNVLPPLTLFPSPYGIHTKSFLHLIIFLCNISSFLFQVTVGPCKLACYCWILSIFGLWDCLCKFSICNLQVLYVSIQAFKARSL